MPVKRSAAKRRLDRLSLNQESHLGCGGYLFPSAHAEGAEFDDEAHRREMWERHREDLMVKWSHVGQRPRAYWDFDQAWPAGAVSESDAVRLLPDTSAEERAAIEAEWVHAIGVALSHTTSLDAARSYAAMNERCGVPGEFFDEHAPRLKADQDAEREAFWARINRPSGNGRAH